MIPRATEALWALALVLAALPAWGEEPAEDPSALFREGYERYEAGDPAGAAEIWKRVLAALGPDEGGKVHYNLGLAHERMGDVTEAIAHHRGFLRWVAARPGALPPELEERRADAAARIQALEESHVELVFPASPQVVVRVDGEPPRPAGFTIYVKPGKHELVIVGPEGTTRGEAVEASAGASLTIDTSRPQPPPPPPVPPPKKPAAPEPAPAEFPLAIVLTGVGLTAASVALPAALYVRADEARDEAAELGAGHSEYPGAREAYAARYDEYRWAYALPAALGAATLGIAIWGAVEVTTSEGSTATVIPSLGPGGASIRGRF